MCGIAGVYNGSIDSDKIRKVTASLYRRGPDQQRVYNKNKTCLIHTRLSIIDLSALGSQPYEFEGLVLIFNGELYNYKEVREQLKLEGYSFQSNSDTEVLIKAFHCWGEQSVHRFIGMFAFCVYNERTNEVYIFRDRLGVKPLYYYFNRGTLYFASDLKTLALFGTPTEIDPDAVSLYFRFGFVPHERSIYSSVHKLEPGHSLRISQGRLTKTKYWTALGKIDEGKKEDDWIDELESLLISSFGYRMIADVPVGVFLSGGMDSSLLAAILQKHHRSIHTFTIGFEEKSFDESMYALKVANHLMVNHTTKTLKLDEARELLNSFYTIYDEPFADTSGIPMTCLAQLAKKAGMKVVLSADGGDELFGGYSHYMKALNLFRKFSRLSLEARQLIVKGSRITLQRRVRKHATIFNLEHKSYALEELLEARDITAFFEAYIANQSTLEIARLVEDAQAISLGAKVQEKDPLLTMMSWDRNYYLPDDLLVKVDRSTMYHSIECREPFLDHRLVEFSLRLPNHFKISNGQGKYILRKLLNRYFPGDYFDRKKQGFSIPIFEWFSKDLDLLFSDYLTTDKLRDVPFLNSEEVIREHKKYLHYRRHSKQYNIEKMWRILSFMMWWEKYKKSAA
jgi:asparagine synthase (glutamine-hydrolysing)